MSKTGVNKHLHSRLAVGIWSAVFAIAALIVVAGVIAFFTPEKVLVKMNAKGLADGSRQVSLRAVDATNPSKILATSLNNASVKDGLITTDFVPPADLKGKSYVVEICTTKSGVQPEACFSKLDDNKNTTAESSSVSGSQPIYSCPYYVAAQKSTKLANLTNRNTVDIENRVGCNDIAQPSIASAEFTTKSTVESIQTIQPQGVAFSSDAILVQKNGILQPVSLSQFEQQLADGNKQPVVNNYYSVAPASSTPTLMLEGRQLRIEGGNAVTLPSDAVSYPNASSSTSGILSSADWNTFAAKENSLTFDNGLLRFGDTVGLMNCAAGQILKNDGTSWVCAADAGSSLGSYTAGTGISISGANVVSNTGVLGVTAGGAITASAGQNPAITLATTSDFTQLANQLALSNTGVAAGTYNNVTVDAKGRVTAGTNITYLTTEADSVVGNEVAGVVTGGGLVMSGTGTAGDPYKVGLVTTCANGQIMKWNGSAWACANDTDTNTDAQTLSYNPTSNILSLTNGGLVDLSDLQDNTDSQAISRTGNVISITGSAGTVDLTPYLDNTDNQTLTITSPSAGNHTVAITGGNSQSLTESQTLGYNAGTRTITLTNGGSVTLPADQDTTYTNGNGLSLTGNVFAISAPTCTGATAKLLWSGTAFTCGTDVDTNTTYTAGSGLSLVGTTFSLAQSGATNGQVLMWNTTNGAWEPTTPSSFTDTDAQNLSYNTTTRVLSIDRGTGVTFPLASGAGAGLLSSSDWNTFSGKENVLTFSDGLARAGNGVSLMDCAANQILQRNGSDTAWQCATQVVDTNTTYTAGSGLSLVGTTFSLTNDFGASIDSSEITNGTIAAADLANSGATAGTYGDSGVNVAQLTVNAGGQVTAISNRALPTANTTTSGILSSTDWSTFNAKENVLTFTGNGLFSRAGNTVTGATCATTGHVLKWNGSAFACAADIDTDTNTTYTSSNGITLTGTNFTLTNDFGASIDSGEITDGTITNADLSSSSVNSSNIVDSSIASADIAGGAITTSKLAACSTNGQVLKYYATDPDGAGPLTTGWNCDTDVDTNTDAVSSVFGRTGAVTAQSGDYTANKITATPSGTIAATDVQAALNELDSEKLAITLASGKIWVGGAGGNATAVDMSGDATIDNLGAITIATNAVALGTDTTGNYVAGATAGNGISITGTAGEGWSPSIAINAPTCSGTTKLQWNGTAFICSADVDTDTTNFNIRANAGVSSNIAAGTTISFIDGTGTTATRTSNDISFNLTNVGTAGTYGSATAVPVITTDAQGRVTSVTSTPINFPSEVDGVVGNEVTTATTNGGLTRSGSGTAGSPYTLGLLSTCSDQQVLKYTLGTTTWGCANDTDTNTTYTAGTGLTLSAGQFSLTNDFGSSIDSSEITNGTVAAADLVNSGATAGTYGDTGVSVAQLTVNAQGQVTAVSNRALPTANTTTSGILSSTDWNTFNGKENVLTFTGNGLFSRAGNTITGTTCATTGHVLKWNGSAFACAADTDTNTIYTGSNGITLTGTNFTLTNDFGASIDSGEITDGTVANVDLAASSVNSSNIVDSSIASADIAGGAITTSKLAACSSNGQILKYYATDPDGVGPLTTGWNCDSDIDTNTDAVASVFGRTGAVTAQNGDYIAGQITNTPSGTIAATTVQAALNELDSEKLAITLGSGQIWVGGAGGNATAVTMSGDATIDNLGAITIAANAVALGTDTTGDYVAGVTAGNGISISGTAGEGWSPSIAINAPTCGGTTKLQWNGTAFVCSADVDTDTDTTNFNILANGAGSQNVADGNNINFQNGTGTTASVDASKNVSFGLNNTTVTSGSYAPSNNANGSMAIPQFTVDAQGRLTAASTTNVTVTGITNAQLANSAVTINASGPLSTTASSVSLGGSATLSLNLSAAGDAVSATTASGSGLEVSASKLGLLRGCSNGQLLKWDSTLKQWACANDTDTNSGGTVTSVTSGNAPIVISGTANAPTVGLNTSGVTANTYGSSTTIPVITVDTYGRITSASSSAIPTASTGATGLLTSSDWNTFNGKENVLTFTGNGLFSRAGNTVTGIAGTVNGQVLKWNGTAWVAGTDADTTYTNGSGLSLATGTFSINSPTCSGTTKLQWNGTAFVCSADVDTDTDTTNFNIRANAGASANIASGGTISFVDGTGTTASRTTNDISFGLTNTGVTANTYGSASTVPVITVDAQGRITSATSTAINFPAEVDGVIGNEVTNATANGGLTRSGSGTAGSPYTLGLLSTCGDQQILKYTLGTTTWACANDTDTNTTYTNGTGLSLVGTTFSLTNDFGSSIDSTEITNGTIAAADLATSGATAGTYGDSGVNVAQLTVNAQGQVTAVSNRALPTANTTTSGILSSTDWNTFNGKENVLTFTGNGLFSRAGNTVTGIAGTVSGQVLKWNGSAWTAGTDIDTTYTAGSGLALSSTTFNIGAGNGAITVNADDIALKLTTATDGLSATTSSGSGLEVLASGVTLLQGCADTQILKWTEASDTWQCSNDNGQAYTSGAGISIASGVVSASGINFSEISNTLSLDAATSIALGTNDLTTNVNGTGAYAVQANGNTVLQVVSTGAVSIGNILSDQTIGIDNGTGSINIATDSDANTTSIGTGTGADTVNIGDSNANVSITDANWSITGAGAANFSSFSGSGLTDCDQSDQVLKWDSATGQFICGTNRATFHNVMDGDYTNATTTFTDVDNNADATDKLGFAAGANETWVFEASMSLISNTTADSKYQVTAPAGSTCDIAVSNIEQAISVSNLACTTSTGSIAIADTLANEVKVSGSIKTGGTAGNVVIQFGQVAASGTSTIHAGSYITAYRISGADYAETYFTNDTRLKPGMIAQLSGTGKSQLEASASAYSDRQVGIVSTSPGSVVGAVDGSGRPIPIALSGRVPILLSTENGLPKAGDMITTSGTRPGYGMKATQSGYIVGQLMLDAVDNGDGTASGFVYVRHGLWQAPIKIDIATLLGATVVGGPNTESGTDISNVVSATEFLSIDQAAIDEIMKGFSIQQSQINELKEKIAAIETVRSSDGVTSGDLASVLTVEGSGITVLGDVRFNGNVSFGANTAGTATVAAGQQSVAIGFARAHPGIPYVTATPTTFVGAEWRVTQMSASGFVIELSSPATNAVQFNWQALNVNND